MDKPTKSVAWGAAIGAIGAGIAYFLLSDNEKEVVREQENLSTSFLNFNLGDETSTTIRKNEKNAETTSRNMEKEGEEIWIKHYCSEHHILLVGEGDFSFAACLARAFGSASNMIATSQDSKNTLKSNYWTAEKNLQELKELGCMILHEVNVHTMTGHSVLQTKKFDIIVFNFPHAGFHGLENDDSQISLHKELVQGFFRSARKMLRNGGEVHVTHKTANPFNKWGVDILAKEEGLVLIDTAQFNLSDYPGYVNKKGVGPNCHEKFRVGDAVTFIFGMA